MNKLKLIIVTLFLTTIVGCANKTTFLLFKSEYQQENKIITEFGQNVDIDIFDYLDTDHLSKKELETLQSNYSISNNFVYEEGKNYPIVGT